jgi:hypothetical protein
MANAEEPTRRPPPVSELGHELLAYLRDLERGRGGYELYGVRGWASAPEIQEAVQNRRREQNAPKVEFSMGADELRSLASKRLLTRVDARIPGAGKAVWLYRIKDAGARRVAAATGTEHARVRAPLDRPEPRVFLRPSVRAALDALKHAEQQRGRREWVAGQPEWRSSNELTAWVHARRRRKGTAPRLFFTEDLAFCIELGLAERRDDPKILYRITPFGRDIRPLVWRDPAVSG